MSVVEQETGIGELLSLPVEQLEADPENPREDFGDMDGLRTAIESEGLLQPLIVRPMDEGYRLVAGERRLKACLDLGWPSIPCIVKQVGSDDLLVAMLNENNQRKDLNPIEEGRAYRKLKADLGLTDVALGARVGKVKAHVQKRMQLLDLTEQQQAEVVSGDLGITAAVAQARINAGRTVPNAAGKKSAAHMTPYHPLADAARSRCQSLGHNAKRGIGVGGVACGKCWEDVIRAHERRTLLEHLERVHNWRAACRVCGSLAGKPIVTHCTACNHPEHNYEARRTESE